MVSTQTKQTLPRLILYNRLGEHYEILEKMSCSASSSQFVIDREGIIAADNIQRQLGISLVNEYKRG